MNALEGGIMWRSPSQLLSISLIVNFLYISNCIVLFLSSLYSCLSLHVFINPVSVNK